MSPRSARQGLRLGTTKVLILSYKSKDSKLLWGIESRQFAAAFMPQVRYVVRVNDLEKHHYEHVFSYPAPDCFVNRANTLEEETDLAVELNKAHCQQILAARPFQCVGCGGKLEKLMEALHLFLTDPADLVVVSFPFPMSMTGSAPWHAPSWSSRSCT